MANKQEEAANHLRELLRQRGLNIPSRNLTLEDNQCWIIFERQRCQVGIDAASGMWVRVNESEWRCIGMPCTVSTAIQAADFLSRV
jgi:hypothetical protein